MADGESINDSVTSLLYNIGRQFIGRYPRYEQNLRDYLINLKCRSMTQYAEYNDYFMNTVYKMTNSANDFWKEKYIAGLPTLFGKRVKEKLTKNNIGELEYRRYTFADLHQTINGVGQELCNNMKLEKKIKTEQYFSKKELGDFCDQFDPFKEAERKKPQKIIKKDNTQSRGKKPYQKDKRRFKKEQPKNKKSYTKDQVKNQEIKINVINVEKQDTLLTHVIKTKIERKV